MSTVRVRIRNLRLRTYIGFNPDETEKKQDVVINVLFEYEAPDGSISKDYWPITLWTRRMLKSQYKQTLREWKEDVTSTSLPGLNNFIFFHCNLSFKNQHIKSPHDAKFNLEEIEDRGIPWGLFGHTHHQGYFIMKSNIKTVLTRAEDEEFQFTEQYRRQNNLQDCPVNSGWERLHGKPFRTLLNPGSVGQPRRHPYLRGAGKGYPRASYMLLKVNGTGHPVFQFRRVPYDVEETVRQLREEVRWPPSTAQEDVHSIYKGEEEQAKIDPMLEETLKNISHTLPVLVEKVLIRKLKTG